MTRVEITSLTKEFPGEVKAIDALDLDVEDGEFFALLGPSGCGKTTLLRTIAGLESPTAGAIAFDGENVTGKPPGERNVGMVFQDYALYPHMTVADNITYPLKVRKVAKDERRKAAADVGSSLQLEALLDRRPGELSGGQQQRAALARAVAYQPGLFLFDEEQGAGSSERRGTVIKTFRGRFTPGDRERSPYVYIPFEASRGATSVSVRLGYDKELATLDLGAFDPEGFRGYSGGARDSFDIGREDATPGYLPGAVPAGEWSVLIGLHRVPEDGVDYAVEVDFDAAAPPPLPPPPRLPERPPRRNLPSSDGRRWLAGDLHCHSAHSDGTRALDELACMARSLGLDFLAVTDHNTVSHHPRLAEAGGRAGVSLIPGQEITAAGGHANCFGDVGWIDFRRSPDDWLADAKARGGLLSINHPLTGDPPWTRRMDGQAPLLEVWHSSWDRRSDDPLRLWEEWGGVGVAGSDFHAPGGPSLGEPTTWVEAEDGDILGGVSAGRVAMSAAPDGPVILRREGALLILDGAGTHLATPEGKIRPVSNDHTSLEAGNEGPYMLLDPEGKVVALSA